MSRDKHRSLGRRLRLLRMAAAIADDNGRAKGIILHREGGMALKNRDLQRLLKDGLLRLYRPVEAYPPKRFRSQEPTPLNHCFGHANVTQAVITAAGRDALE